MRGQAHLNDSGHRARPFSSGVHWSSVKWPIALAVLQAIRGRSMPSLAYSTLSLPSPCLSLLFPLFLSCFAPVMGGSRLFRTNSRWRAERRENWCHCIWVSRRSPCLTPACGRGCIGVWSALATREAGERLTTFVLCGAQGFDIFVLFRMRR